MRLISIKAIGVIGFLCLLFYGSTLNTLAQELSVAIDPPIIQINAEAPSQIRTPISIQNESNQTTTYNIFLVPFKAGSENNGQPEYDNELIASYKPIFNRIKILEENRPLTEVSLAPKQSKNLELSISVAKNEKPRDYYFSVIFVSQGSDGGTSKNGVGAKAGIGTNVLLSIGPKQESIGRIEEFSAPKFVSSGPIEFKLNVANNSNHYVNTSGNLIIKNIFGQVVGNLELIPANILENSQRLMESKLNPDPNTPKIIWNEKFLIGIYKANLELALSDEGPLLKKELTVIAFPIQALILFFLIAVFSTGMIRRARHKSD